MRCSRCHLLTLLTIGYAAVSWALLFSKYYGIGRTVGRSMYRTLGESSIVILRVYNATEASVGTLKLPIMAAISLNYGGEELLVTKWVTRICGDRFWFEGEHPFSLSSRDVGWLSVYQIKFLAAARLVIKPPSQKTLHEVAMLNWERQYLRDEGIRVVDCPAWEDKPPSHYLLQSSTTLRRDMWSDGQPKNHTISAFTYPVWH